MLRCHYRGCDREFKKKQGLALHHTRVHPNEVPDRSPSPVQDADDNPHDAEFWEAFDRRLQEDEEARQQQARNAELAEGMAVDPAAVDATGTPHRQFDVQHYPGAGWPCDSDGEFLPEHDSPPVPFSAETILHDQSQPFYPFADRISYKLLRRWARTRLSESKVKAELDDLEELLEERPHKSRKAAWKVSEDIPYAGWTEWFNREVFIPSPSHDTSFLNKKHLFVYRNLRRVLAHLLSSPSFRGQQHYGPTRYTTEEGEYISEPYTASDAWDFQATLPHGHLGIRLDISSDATNLSNATGGVVLHPIYVKVAVNQAVVSRENRGGIILVGFFPNSKGGVPSAHRALFSEFTRNIKHHCLGILLEPLRSMLSTSELFRFADGHWRWSRLYVGKYPFDYPEGVWLLGLVSGWVACCDTPPKQLGTGAGETRTTLRSDQYRAAGPAVAYAHGLHMTRTVWSSFGIDGHALHGHDPLHQVLAGATRDIFVKNLLLEYLLIIAGSRARYDMLCEVIRRRLACIPVYPDLRKFKSGIVFAQWTGNDSRALLKVLSSVLYDLSLPASHGHEEFTITDDIARSFSWLSVIYRFATSLESTPLDRQILSKAIEYFNKSLRDAFEEDRDGFNWPRLHALFHYVEWTVKSGVASNSDTGVFENSHIRKVKNPYRDSNRCNSLEQILTTNSRNDRIEAMQVELEAAVQLPPERAQPKLVYPSPAVFMAMRSRFAQQSIDGVAETRDLPQLHTAIVEYVQTYTGLGDVNADNCKPSISTHASIRVTFPTYPHPPVLSEDTCKETSQAIYASHTYNFKDEGQKGPRHDVVLVRNSKTGPNLGLGAFDLYRARLFFSFKWRGRDFKVCLGEEMQYRDHRRPDDVVLNPQARARVDAHGNRIYSVFPISKIYRSVHLQALFGTVDPGVDYSHKTVLDQWPGWFMVQLLNDIHLTKMFWSSLWNWEE